MTHRIVWTEPLAPGMSATCADRVEWDSKDMAQLAAVLMLSNGYVGPAKYRHFTTEEIKAGPRAKR
jgi:hypothetical protein